MMEVFRPSWRQLWKEWELRGLVILSLTAQIILVILGNRRKYIAGTWIRLIVWSTYLLADYIAAMAVGILSNDLGEVYSKHSGFVDAGYELRAFWAPLLLSHLGGTDAITAYSLEDNELWRRHSFGVITQAIMTLYVLLTAWTSSRFSLLSIAMFWVGFVKYSERVCVLYLASQKKFRNLIPNIPTDGSKVTAECKLKEVEGYNLTHQVLEVEVLDHSANTLSDEPIPGANDLLTAISFLEMVKRLFADVILGFNDRDVSRAIFEKEDFPADKAFKIIEIELSFIYDLLYTKAKAVYSLWGIIVRIIGIILTISVLVMFLTLIKKQGYSKIDLNITLVLLVIAILLELCAIADLLLSDQTAHWLIKHKKTAILQKIECLSPVSQKHRWSNSINQLTFSTEEKAFPYRILKILCIDELLEIHRYETPASLSSDLKKFIFEEIKKIRPPEEKKGSATDLKALFGRRGGRTVRKHNRDDLDWSVKLGFDQSILIWHLATLIYSKIESSKRKGDTSSNRDDANIKISKCLSQYLLYLLVVHPNMLPIGIGHIRFQDIHADVGNFIEQGISKKTITTVIPTIRGGGNFVIVNACKLALALLYPEEAKKEYKSNKTEEVTEGCKSNEPNEDGEENKSEHRKDNWDMIANVWLEMLGHAASQCGGAHHARQLRKGGELLTHVWLLMAHLGLTDHFQIEYSPTIAASVVW
uniref:DUF4220 domain-containing protein n=1 Tax=Fagus sylvatica TaxID=28930 RepID=A0A2N9H739_FAGSY